jgi:hypothetical protein
VQVRAMGRANKKARKAAATAGANGADDWL